IPAGANVLMMEDVVTTGLSSRECIEAIKAHGGKVVAAASLVDRSGGKARVGVKLISLLKLKAPTYEASKLPASLKKIEAIKPGSRGLKA
ncbi:MAG: phosphoribosyltransferase family protein, partial [Alphaproteobacteria bacterium]